MGTSSEIHEASGRLPEIVNRVRNSGEVISLTESGAVIAEAHPPAAPKFMLSDLAELMERVSHLGTGDAEQFEKDLGLARSELDRMGVRSSWDT